MRRSHQSTGCSVLGLIVLLGSGPAMAGAQEFDRLFPPLSLFPVLLAGPRDPVTSFTPLGVTDNPNAHGPGVEVEVALGSTLPVLLLGSPGHSPLVAGIEAAVFARFGLQVLERELIATDWVFAVPVYWLRDAGWFRFRYYHSSSHMGDEYARRFQDPGVNFARDAAEVMAYRTLTPRSGVYAGARYAYIVHPEGSKRWVLRAGAQAQRGEDPGSLQPFAAADLEWDQDAGPPPRTELRTGVWFPEIEGRRSLRLSLTFLTGPSPLGQFNGRSTTQIGLGLQGRF